MRWRWETEGFVWKFHQGSCFCIFFLRVVCEYDRHSFLATVFASAFNGDLNQWDVAKVTTMEASKSVRMLENDLT